MSTNDLVSIFLSIELQSYGLYILSTIYRNSELSTAGGLMYFLLGGLSSCFILLGSSLLYVNSGTTSLDSLYVINSISSDVNYNITSWYKSYYLNFSLFIFSIGFLFKVGAVPFHFWSPDRGPVKSSLFGNKLPNSRATLKLLVPNYIRKNICRWSNQSCKVTSQKASEKNVGYRGSKSAIGFTEAVKEQRVYGSCRINSIRLRCTLTGFEWDYQVKNHSNLIIQRRFYSKVCDTCTIRKYNNLSLNNQYTYHIAINEAWFITGFADGEGCFLVVVRRTGKNTLGW